MTSTIPAFKTLLIEWNLKQYIPNFESQGYDEISDWPSLSLEELTDQSLAMKLGHAKRFIRKMEEKELQSKYIPIKVFINEAFLKSNSFEKAKDISHVIQIEKNSNELYLHSLKQQIPHMFQKSFKNEFDNVYKYEWYIISNDCTRTSVETNDELTVELEGYLSSDDENDNELENEQHSISDIVQLRVIFKEKEVVVQIEEKEDKIHVQQNIMADNYNNVIKTNEGQLPIADETGINISALINSLLPLEYRQWCENKIADSGMVDYNDTLSLLTKFGKIYSHMIAMKTSSSTLSSFYDCIRVICGLIKSIIDNPAIDKTWMNSHLNTVSKIAHVKGADTLLELIGLKYVERSLLPSFVHQNSSLNFNSSDIDIFTNFYQFLNFFLKTENVEEFIIPEVFNDIEIEKELKTNDTPMKESVTYFTEDDELPFEWYDRRNRTIVFLGETGAGKTSSINSMMNYLFQIEMDDTFRKKLIYEDFADKDMSESQTNKVTIYRLQPTRLRYNLTIIDTPGFNDTKGKNTQKLNVEKITNLFTKSITECNMICFVIQSSQSKLTPTLKFICDQILSLFTVNIEQNIYVLITYADGGIPPALSSLSAYKIPFEKYFKINNSSFALPLKCGKDEWDRSMQGFQELFDALYLAPATSLQMVKELLQEKQNLNDFIANIRPQIKTLLKKLQSIKKLMADIKISADKINAPDAKISFIVLKCIKTRKVVDYVSRVCLKCRKTCCEDCPATFRSFCRTKNFVGNGCNVCSPNADCSKFHSYEKFIFVSTMKYVSVTGEELVKRQKEYRMLKNCVLKLSKSERLINSLIEDMVECKLDFCKLVNDVRRCINRLSSIALANSKILSWEWYIQQMIDEESEEKEEGWKERVQLLKEMKLENIRSLFGNSNVLDVKNDESLFSFESLNNLRRGLSQKKLDITGILGWDENKNNAEDNEIDLMKFQQKKVMEKLLKEKERQLFLFFTRYSNLEVQLQMTSIHSESMQTTEVDDTNSYSDDNVVAMIQFTQHQNKTFHKCTEPSSVHYCGILCFYIFMAIWFTTLDIFQITSKDSYKWLDATRLLPFSFLSFFFLLEIKICKRHHSNKYMKFLFLLFLVIIHQMLVGWAIFVKHLYSFVNFPHHENFKSCVVFGLYFIYIKPIQLIANSLSDHVSRANNSRVFYFRLIFNCFMNVFLTLIVTNIDKIDFISIILAIIKVVANKSFCFENQINFVLNKIPSFCRYKTLDVQPDVELFMVSYLYSILSSFVVYIGQFVFVGVSYGLFLYGYDARIAALHYINMQGSRVIFCFLLIQWMFEFIADFLIYLVYVHYGSAEYREQWKRISFPVLYFVCVIIYVQVLSLNFSTFYYI